jgi:hypothetical protein
MGGMNVLLLIDEGTTLALYQKNAQILLANHQEP